MNGEDSSNLNFAQNSVSCKIERNNLIPSTTEPARDVVSPYVACKTSGYNSQSRDNATNSQVKFSIFY